MDIDNIIASGLLTSFFQVNKFEIHPTATKIDLFQVCL